VVVDPSDGPLFRLIELSVSLVLLSAFSCYCLPGRLLRLVTVLLAGLSVLLVPLSISLFCSAGVIVFVHYRRPCLLDITTTFVLHRVGLWDV
jgi:hypothetical protein